ncbi:asparagine synthase-related protein [Emticicia sp. 17c]|uniref:asparagine synthase-related protein n=1 Tax=Emticicia sp. 17c TaxID=3127704 RepID=UPI00301E3CAA
MSAIFGIINKHNSSVNQADVNTMSIKLRHHAVDNQKIFLRENIMLGYHQLVFHHSQKNEQVPFESGQYLIVADTRIDNRVALATLLGAKQKPTEIADSWLILEAFKKWGKRCVDYLEGEFCFLIYNQREQSFFAASDHIGHRSFYYYDSPEHFIFASELKAVLAVKPPPHSFNEDIIIRYFVVNYNEQTPIKNIFLLRGGHYLSYDKQQGLQQYTYWLAHKTGKYRFQSLREYGECLRHLMTEAIKNRIEIDKPIGIKLSGGLDSSFIACILGELLAKQNKSFSAFSSVAGKNDINNPEDESYYMKLLGQHIPNMEQVFVTPPANATPFDNLPQLFEQGDGFMNPLHYLDTALMEAAQKQGVRLLFNGYGGDHAISNPYREYIFFSLLQFKIKESLKVFNTIRHTYQISVFRLLQSSILYHTRFYNFLKGLSGKAIYNGESFFNPELAKSIKEYENSQSFDTKQWLQDRINAGVLGCEHQLLNYRDAYFGLRKTTPYFDKPILELYLDVPDTMMFENGYKRGLIREAMKGIVPDEIVWRKDKKSYSPDFENRLGAINKLKQKLVNEQAYQNIWPYMNKKRFLTNKETDINNCLAIMLFNYISYLKLHIN